MSVQVNKNDRSIIKNKSREARIKARIATSKNIEYVRSVQNRLDKLNEQIKDKTNDPQNTYVK